MPAQTSPMMHNTQAGCSTIERALYSAATKKAKAAAPKSSPKPSSIAVRNVRRALCRQELPFGLKQVKETDDEFSQTLHAGSYLYWRNNQESAQPAPKATSRLVTGFRRTCSPTCSMPALPAS